MPTNDEYRLALRRRGRERDLADLREGRKRRAQTIPSGKQYRRKPKHTRRDKE